MSINTLELARKANEVCLTPVETVDPRFLREYTRLVVNECIVQMMIECCQQELDANPFRARLCEHFDIDYIGRQK